MPSGTSPGRQFFEAMQPHARGRVYLNFLDDEGQERVRDAYGARNYERLVALKRTHDPTSLSASTRTSNPEPRHREARKRRTDHA